MENKGFKVGDEVMAPKPYNKFNSVFKIVAITIDFIILRKILSNSELENVEIMIKPTDNIKLMPYNEITKILYGN